MPVYQNKFAPDQSEPRQLGVYTSAEEWEAAYSESALGSYERLTRASKIPPESGFDPRNMFDANNPLHNRYADDLAKVRSTMEWRWMEGQLRELEKHRLIRESGNAAGMWYSLGLEVVNPANLIPIAGVAGGVFRSGARIGGSVAATVVADEAVRRASDPTRTGMETAFNIGSAAVLGFGLGAAARYLQPRTFAEELARIEELRADFEEFERRSGTVGAARAPGAQGDLRSSGNVIIAGQGTRVGRAINAGASWLGRQVSPTFDMVDRQRRVSYPLRSAAAFAEQMGLTLRTEGSRMRDSTSALGLNQPQARGGQLVEKRYALEHHFIQRVEAAVTDAYSKMAFGTKTLPGVGTSALYGAARLRGRAVMTPAEFKDRLFQALNQVEPTGDQYIDGAVQQLRKEVIDPIGDFLVQTGVLRQEQIDSVREEFGVYFPFIYDHQKVTADTVVGEDGRVISFLDSLTDYAAKQFAEQAQTRRANALAEADKWNELADDLLLSEEAANQLEAQLRAQLGEMSTGEWAQAQEAVREIRDELALAEQRALDPALTPAERVDAAQAVADVKKRLKEIHETNPQIAEGRKAKARVQKRLSNLAYRYERVLGRRVESLRKIADIEAANVNTLLGLGERLAKLRKNWDKWSPEVRERELAKLRNQFAKAEKVYEKGEDQIAKLLEDMPELRTGETDELTRRAQRQRLDIFADLLEPAPERMPTLAGVRGAKGETNMTIRTEEQRQAVLDRIDAVLDEGEYPIRDTEGNPTEFVEVTPQLRSGLERFAQEVEQTDISDVAALQEAMERLMRLEGLQASRGERLSDIADKFAKWDEASVEEQIALIVEAMDAVSRKAGDTVSRRAERVQRLRTQLANDPKYQIARMDDKTREKLEKKRAAAVKKLESGERRVRVKQDNGKFKYEKVKLALEERADLRAEVQTIDNQLNAGGEPMVNSYVEGHRAKASRADERFRNWMREHADVYRGDTPRQQRNLSSRVAAGTASDQEVAQLENIESWMDPYAEGHDFRQIARAWAEEYRNFIRDEPVRTPEVDFTVGKTGSTLSRMKIPYEVRAPFLVRDPTIALRTYTRNVIPQGLLRQAFGSEGVTEILNGNWGVLVKERDEAIRQIDADLDSAGNPLAKTRTEEEKVRLRQEVQDNFDQSQSQMAYLVRQMRHQVGIPQDPNHWLSRIGEFLLHFNVLTKMGNVVPASVSDTFRATMRFGLTDAFGSSWEAGTNWSPWAKLAEELGMGTDPWDNARAFALADLEETPMNRTAWENMLTSFSAAMGKVNGVDAWNRWAKVSLLPIINRRFMDALETVVGSAQAATRGDTAAAKAAAKMDREKALDILADAGVDDDLAYRIWGQLEEQAALNGQSALMRNKAGTLMPNLANWSDMEAKHLMMAYYNKEANQTIITPNFVDVPRWMKENPMARIIMQFRSFGMASTTRTALAGMQQRDRAVLSGVLGMLGMGMVSYYAWAAQQGQGELKKALEGGWERAIDEAFIRSGLLGIMGDGLLFAQNIPVLGEYTRFSPEGTARANARFMEGDIYGPSYGTISNLLRVVGDLGTEGGFDQGTVHTIRKLTFYQNVFYLRYLFTQVEKAAVEVGDIPSGQR